MKIFLSVLCLVSASSAFAAKAPCTFAIVPTGPTTLLEDDQNEVVSYYTKTLEAMNCKAVPEADAEYKIRFGFWCIMTMQPAHETALQRAAGAVSDILVGQPSGMGATLKLKDGTTLAKYNEGFAIHAARDRAVERKLKAKAYRVLNGFIAAISEREDEGKSPTEE